MFNYRDKYVFKYERNKNGEIYNKFDNYLACRAKGQIYRYNNDTLVFYSPKKIKYKKIDKGTGTVIYDYSNLFLQLIDTEEERVIYFKEEHFDELSKLFKVRKKRKLSEEAKLATKIRLQEARKKKGLSVEITEEDAEEELNDEIDDNLELDELEG